MCLIFSSINDGLDDSSWSVMITFSLTGVVVREWWGALVVGFLGVGARVDVGCFGSWRSDGAVFSIFQQIWGSNIVMYI